MSNFISPNHRTFWFMVFLMFTFIRKQLKIFRTVILSIFNATDWKVNTLVMNYLFWFKKSANLLFHNKTTSANISFFCSKWMFWLKNINISSFHNSYSTFPIPVFRTHHSKTNFFLMFFSKSFTFMTKTNLFSLFNSRFISFMYFRHMFSEFRVLPKFIHKFFVSFSIFLCFYITTFFATIFSFSAFVMPKFFIANFTNVFNHSITSKIKALFRYLIKQQLSYSTLLSAKFEHKKVATLLDNFIITDIGIVSI